MVIDHTALVTRNIEAMKDFYVKYFEAVPHKWVSDDGTGVLYFLSFEEGGRLELEQRLESQPFAGEREQTIGLAHIAFLAKSREELHRRTARLEADGYTIVTQPTDYGTTEFYESSFLDPDRNLVEMSVGAEYL